MGDGVLQNPAKWYKQPSTWLGVLKIVLGAVAYAKGVDPAIVAGIGALGAVDVVRQEPARIKS